MKRILFILAFLTLNFACFAAESESAWSFGIHAGADVPIYWVNLKSLAFVTGGFTAGYSFNDFFSLQTELNYFAISVSEYNLTVHFLQVPILAKIEGPFQYHKDITLFLDLGPAIDCLIGFNSNNNYTGPTHYTWNNKLQRIGIIAGAGIAFQLDNGSKIGLEIRYDWILQVFNSGVHVVYDDLDSGIYPANIISAMAGYTF